MEHQADNHDAKQVVLAQCSQEMFFHHTIADPLLWALIDSAELSHQEVADHLEVTVDFVKEQEVLATCADQPDSNPDDFVNSWAKRRFAQYIIVVLTQDDSGCYRWLFATPNASANPRPYYATAYNDFKEAEKEAKRLVGKPLMSPSGIVKVVQAQVVASAFQVDSLIG